MCITLFVYFIIYNIKIPTINNSAFGHHDVGEGGGGGGEGGGGGGWWGVGTYFKITSN